MTTLAPKLPWTHPFAGGYPRVAGQALPTDPDAIDYLNRVAAADGAAVEVGVAMAVDAFVRGCKADGIWDALKASCIMCGARTISGALVPLVGTAPTPYNFASGDYSRTTGLKGDGSTKYLDSNRSNNADGQNDAHLSVYVAANGSTGVQYLAGAGGADAGASNIGGDYTNPSSPTIFRSRYQLSETAGSISDAGFFASSRSEAAAYVMRASGVNVAGTYTSQTPYNGSVYVFSRNAATTFPADAHLAFYSIGSALDLAALDTRVSTLVAAIAAAL